MKSIAGKQHIVDALITRGVDVSIKDDYGKKALDYAVENGKIYFSERWIFFSEYQACDFKIDFFSSDQQESVDLITAKMHASKTPPRDSRERNW